MNMNRIGHESLEAFVQTTQTVVTETPFDYILAASDSGQLANHITNRVYDALDLPHPPALVAPIFRHVDKARTILFDNSLQAANFPEWQSADFKTTLFTDDEIWRGATLNGLLDLVLALNIRIGDLTVIAEDGGFEHGGEIRGIPLRYVPPKQRVPDIYNAFSYTIPEQFELPIRDMLPDEPSLNHKQIMCTLLGLPIKDRLHGKPFFSTRLLGKVAVGLNDFKSYQEGYSTWLDRTVQKYMND